MNVLMKPLILAIACIGENALVRAGDTQYQLHEKNALNASIDTLVDLIVEVVNKKLEKFYSEIPVYASAPRYLDTQTGVAERKIQVEPAELIDPELQHALLTTVMMVAHGMIKDAGTLFSEPIASALTPERAGFVEEQISSQIKKHNGKKITKPGVLALNLPSQTALEIPVQGTFTPPTNLPEGNGEIMEILAQPDGIKASKMQIFLRPICETNHTVSQSVTYLAGKPSQIQLAAEAYLDGNLMLKALVAEVKAKKGQKNEHKFVIKDLKTVPLDKLSNEGELQL